MRFTTFIFLIVFIIYRKGHKMLMQTKYSLVLLAATLLPIMGCQSHEPAQASYMSFTDPVSQAETSPKKPSKPTPMLHGNPFSHKCKSGSYRRLLGGKANRQKAAKARAIYIEIQELRQRYYRAKVQGDSLDALEESFDQKEALRDELDDAYDRVFDTESPFWRVRILYERARAQEHLGDLLSRHPKMSERAKLYYEFTFEIYLRAQSYNRLYRLCTKYNTLINKAVNRLYSKASTTNGV